MAETMSAEIKAKSAKGSGAPRRWRMSRTSRTGWLFAAPLLVFLVIFVAYPVVRSVIVSFTNTSILTGKDDFIGLANYADAFTDPDIGPVTWTSILWTAGSLLGQLGVGLAAALLINQPLKGLRFIRPILIVPYVVPAISLALVWRWMLDGRYGIAAQAMQSFGMIPIDQTPLAMSGLALPSVIVANIWRAFPFAMLIYWAALQSIDQSQYEAAAVDGAGAWKRFVHITLPALSTATVSLIVIRGMWTVTYFDLIYLITKGGPAGVTTHWPIWIYEEAMGKFHFGYASALATIVGLVLFGLILVYYRVSESEKKAPKGAKR